MFGWVRETRLRRANAECARRRVENRELKAEVEELTEDLGYSQLALGRERAVLAAVQHNLDELADDVRQLLVERDAARELNADLLGQLESQTNALHARGRSIDYLVGEVDDAQEDARAAKVLAAFWMQAWLSGLHGEQKGITA